MGLFKFFSKKRAAAIGFQPQKSPQKTSLQTFILEPILTPSGLLDGGDSTPDPVVMDWNMDTLPDVDLPDMDVDADAGDAISNVDLLGSVGDATDTLADVDLPDADGETDARDTFAASNYEVEIPDADIEPVDFFYGDKDDSLGAIAESRSIASVDLLDIDADTDVDLPDTDPDTDAIANVDLLGSVGDTDGDTDANAIANVGLADIDATTDATDASVDVDLLDTDATGADADTETPDDGIEAVDFVYNDADNPVTDVIQPSPTFNSGVFTVGDTGEVSIDFLFDGGQYQGELAVFSLDGMDGFEPGSEAFIKEAASRALSNSELGHIALSDTTEGARFSGTLPYEGNFNTGAYQGVKTFSMRPGDTFGVMLVPHGTLQQLYDNPAAEGYGRPLFSMTTSKPTDLFHMGQIADVTGDGNTFVMEDMGVDGWTDKDYNDVIFQVRGATGKAGLLDDVIDSGKDWRSTDMGEALIAYAKPYITPDAVDDGGAIAVDTIPDFEDTVDDGDAIATDPIADNEDIAENPADDTDVVEEHIHAGEVPVTNTVQPQPFEFAKENQPLVGVIDTGFSANNPDIDYSRIILGQDRVNGDANPLLSVGEGNEHGTHVLGIIGATQDNGVGIDGINDDAPLWVGRGVGSGKWADSLVEFVDAAKESGQPNAVVNLSLDLTQVNPDGSVTTRYEFTPAERAAIEYARQHNVLIVAAAGNDGGVMSVLGQASQEFDNIITVGAAERVNDEVALSKAFDRAAYSSYGNGLDIMAPGGTVENLELSTTGDGVGTMAGTSVASAKVTGAVSQVWAANPGLSYRQVIEILKNTATDLKDTGWDLESGAGLLNIAAAVHLAKATKPEAYDPEDISTPITWGGEGLVTPSERAVNQSSTVENGGWWAEYYQGDFGSLVSSGVFPEQQQGGFLAKDWGWDSGPVGLAEDFSIKLFGKRYLEPGQHRFVVNADDRSRVKVNGQEIITAWYTGSGTKEGYFESTGGYYNIEVDYKEDSGAAGITLDWNKVADTKQSTIENGGWWAEYYQGDFGSLVSSGAFPEQQQGGFLVKDWGWDGGPVGLAEDFSIKLFGKRYLEPGQHRFVVNADDRSRVKVNGQEIISAWYTGSGTKEGYFESTGGYYNIEVDYKEDSGAAGITLDWNKVVVPVTSETIKGFTVSGSFYPVFKNYQGTLGNPIENVQHHSSGVTYQRFQNGSIVSSKHGTFPLYGGIRQTYLKNQGLDGWLSTPTSAEVPQGNGVIKQTFEGGYIIWNGSTATAYRTGSSTGSQTVPIPNQPRKILVRTGGHESLNYWRFDKTLPYMFNEMKNNAVSNIALSIKSSLKQSIVNYATSISNPSVSTFYYNLALFNYASALGQWTLMVRASGDWDHKPKLEKLLNLIGDDGRKNQWWQRSEDDDYYFPIRRDVNDEYYYDIWSNIHYGYVGTAVGFTRKVLQDGAASYEPLLAGVNDESDRIGVDIGIDLWNKYKSGLTEEQLHQGILDKKEQLNSAGRIVNGK